MKALWSIAIALLLAATSAAAADKGTTDEAVALTKKAIALYKASGKDKAYAEIDNKSGPFVDRDLYVFVLDKTGTMHAHGANPKLIGKNLTMLKDADGKTFMVDMVNIVKSGNPGWVDYKWTNPTSGQIENKRAYVEPYDGLGFAVGVYK
jgi:cytochrome c